MIRVRCTQASVPGWVAWARYAGVQIFGEFVEWTCTTDRANATEFATEAEAEQAAAWLRRANRSIGLTTEMTEIDQ